MKRNVYVVIILNSLLMSLASANVSYKVTGVENWDSLNMRSNAGTSSNVVAKLPYNATNISTTGQKEVIGSTTWIQIRYQGKTGWVSHKYLSSAPIPQSSPASVPSPSSTKVVTRPSTSPAPADQRNVRSGWVTGVAKDDTLSLREAAGVNNPLVAKIPPNGKVILTGKHKTVDGTQWGEVRFNGKTGWVSKRYIREAKTTVSKAAAPTPTRPAKPISAPTPTRPAKPVSAPSPKPVQGIITKKQSGMWILECGNASPYWKVEVLPEWMSIYTPQYETGVPIAYKRQRHGKWNQTAVRTELGGKRGTLGLDMTLSYTAKCYSTLSQRKVTFNVKGQLNGEEISGCCRSYLVP